MTANERLIAEQAVMNFRALNAASNAADDGTVLGIAEQLAVKQGREATRQTLEISLQLQNVDWAKRLEIRDPSAITVLLANGAKWIWEEARLNLVGSRGVLDIYHALEAVSDTSKTVFGEGKTEANSWTNPLRPTILERGWEGFDQCWQQTRNRFPESSPQSTSLTELRNYLGNHASQMNYAERLMEGRSIGSGQIEGACKNLIGRRFKQTAAKRLVRTNRDANALMQTIGVPERP